MIILGIDPGVNNGVSEFDSGNLRYIKTLTTIELILHIYLGGHAIDAIIIEDSLLQSHLFTDKKANTADKKPISAQLQALCNLLQH